MLFEIEAMILSVPAQLIDRIEVDASFYVSTRVFQCYQGEKDIARYLDIVR